MHTRSVFLADAAATRALGVELARLWLAAAGDAPPGSAAVSPPILLLRGDLGAGKTSLVQGVAEGLGIAEPITSPTFALAQHYAGVLADGSPTALVHIDLYRLDQPAGADELLAQEEEEALGLGALLAVEWPERLSSTPAGAWLVALELADGADPEAGRTARITNPRPA
ncbi:tRNA (adenosine(37)-N6)-threonylcarbamoyltransferase complex ATPase subunit type 1 TsaE [Cyanobium sp. CH-040]|uniref:tRNA (adenosine(37)-N6)-threonylcarbamoyltransferase complex ATPase subunit type 1 TsaE n=1 Tax=Cyanobium sp. CH-040 TaxID=2823708 RepID=UPI0020CDFF16|nr:tRNA (adenosine(37)-N6)-threonylcarbamoyltransferase complex ATPase subunit type 1 TsaE [Cyanobium sp. CH-040]MCP9926575.1 tRNA (adenosine(37)-N6)-threonylcarbamoyltransferase complex ATPase subunit type 1 TsaE [Cyanobium sp. CH-040]